MLKNTTLKCYRCGQPAHALDFLPDNGIIRGEMERVVINNYIIANPKICHGKPTFKGTRIMVWQVLEMLEAGEGIKEILENYPSLTQKHIRAALRYAAERVAKERFIPFPTSKYAVSSR